MINCLVGLAIKASLIMGLTIGLYSHDAAIRAWAQENRNNLTRQIAEHVEPFGSGGYTLAVLHALAIYGNLYGDERAQRTARLGFKSLVASALLTYAIKLATHRHRPSSGQPPTIWDGPSLSGEPLSFPSGHASTAFAVATVIATEYKDQGVVPWLAYGLATLTALSRIHDDAHWASDVFFGSALGYFSSRVLMADQSGILAQACLP